MCNINRLINITKIELFRKTAGVSYIDSPVKLLENCIEFRFACARADVTNGDGEATFILANWKNVL